MLAAKAVSFFVSQITCGALEEIGADTKEYLQKLASLLYKKFAGSQAIEQATENPQILEAEILKEIPKDINFREELETLVKKLENLQTTTTNNNVSQNSSGNQAPNIKMGNVNVESNTGNFVIGGNQTINKFR